MKKLLTQLSLSAAACLLAFSATAAERTTRDLVFEDSAAPAKAQGQSGSQVVGGQTQAIGVKTTIVLKRDGKTSTVPPGHEFKSGDSVKLVFTPSINGYVYWMSKGSSGSYTMLFPSAKSGMDNAVVRNKEYSIPVKGVFRFDDKAGKEELLCILSEQKLPDLEQAMAGTDAKAAAEIEKKNAAKRTTRDLVFEDASSGDVNTKQQTAVKGEPFVAHYVLNHK